MLKQKTVILVTHHLSYMKKVDHIVFLKNGRIAEQGSYDEIMSSGLEASRLIREYSGAEDKEEETSPTVETNTPEVKNSRPAQVMLEEV